MVLDRGRWERGGGDRASRCGQGDAGFLWRAAAPKLQRWVPPAASRLLFPFNIFNFFFLLFHALDFSVFV